MASTRDIQLRDCLTQEFGEEQAAQILELFCGSGGVELSKVRQSADNQDQRRLLHNSRGLRGVCQSVFVDDMAQTCLEIEKAAGNTSPDWSSVAQLVTRLEGEFAEICNSISLGR
ncbi:MAG: Hpt domain-containing protein [Candidatus Obscuribacterales bacterium]|jgi:HPt (histidine-containing phosphotransfer) domain-containing protein